MNCTCIKPKTDADVEVGLHNDYAAAHASRTYERGKKKKGGGGEHVPTCSNKFQPVRSCLNLYRANSTYSNLTRSNLTLPNSPNLNVHPYG